MVGVILTVTPRVRRICRRRVAKKPGTGSGTAVTVPVTGTGSTAGTFAVQRFTNSGGELVAVGTFTGTVQDATGAVASGSQRVALPVDLAQSTGTCEILDLVLGPLRLDLLGLVVDLNQVHLTITAKQGPATCSGICCRAVAGQLDGNIPAGGLGGLLNQIAALLNQILSIISA